jgi:hypothetical protein
MRSPINDSRPTKSRQRCPYSHPCAKGGMAALAGLFSSLRREGGGHRDECRFAAGTPDGQRTDPQTLDEGAGLFSEATPLFPACRSCARATGRPTAFSTPTSPARQLRSGQRMRLFNDRGSVGLVLRASDKVQPANLFVPGSAPMRGGVEGDQYALL